MRLFVSLGLAAAIVSSVLAQAPADLAKPPANARHFVIQSTGGKHGDSWRWTAADGARMGRESMNLRGQVFELESSGTVGGDGMPSAITIRGVTPQGDAGETFTAASGAGVGMVSKFLKMPIELVRELMPKVEYNMTLTDRAVSTIKISEEQLQRQGKLSAPLDYSRYIYTDLLKKVRADNVKLTSMPK